MEADAQQVDGVLDVTADELETAVTVVAPADGNLDHAEAELLGQPEDLITALAGRSRLELVTMEIVSYAQFLEDVRLARVFGQQPTGCYIDVGAGHPIDASVTKHFYEAGWSGINVEPVPHVFDLLCADRPRDTNVHAVLAEREGVATLYGVTDNPDLSTVARGRADVMRGEGHEIVEYTVPTATLRDLCERYVDRPIDS